jgi:ABC-type transport system involved in cytochrome c biogenesis permease component
VKNSPVVVALLTEIVTSDICVLVMFPLRVRMTVFLLSVVAGTVAFGCVTGIGVGDEVGVGVEVEFEAPNAKRVPSSKPT